MLPRIRLLAGLLALASLCACGGGESAGPDTHEQPSAAQASTEVGLRLVFNLDAQTQVTANPDAPGIDLSNPQTFSHGMGVELVLPDHARRQLMLLFQRVDALHWIVAAYIDQQAIDSPLGATRPAAVLAFGADGALHSPLRVVLQVPAGTTSQGRPCAGLTLAVDLAGSTQTARAYSLDQACQTGQPYLRFPTGNTSSTESST